MAEEGVVSLCADQGGSAKQAAPLPPSKPPPPPPCYCRQPLCFLGARRVNLWTFPVDRKSFIDSEWGAGTRNRLLLEKFDGSVENADAQICSFPFFFFFFWDVLQCVFQGMKRKMAIVTA